MIPIYSRRSTLAASETKIYCPRYLLNSLAASLDLALSVVAFEEGIKVASVAEGALGSGAGPVETALKLIWVDWCKPDRGLLGLIII
ncbi:MAG: hypothetical protein QOF89_4060 [Acidobacteriota bacterium]|nr:hypothetical protein [Acidobacteriota bacterium]